MKSVTQALPSEATNRSGVTLRSCSSSITMTTLLLVIQLFSINNSVHAFQTPATTRSAAKSILEKKEQVTLYSSTARDDFSSFANSLDDSSPITTPKSNTFTANSASAFTQRPKYQSQKHQSQPLMRTWKDDLEELLDPQTSLARKQILLSDLVNANAEIRQAVQTAIRDRKIDPLLTPRGLRIQDNTRAVARQLTTDILPMFVKQARNAITSPPPLMPPSLDRVALQLSSQLNQAKSFLESALPPGVSPTTPLLPLPSPELVQSLSKQTSEILQDIFNEMPVGLQEPPYKVVKTTPYYEIRDYEAYTVASTMAGLDGYSSMNSVSTSNIMGGPGSVGISSGVGGGLMDDNTATINMSSGAATSSYSFDDMSQQSTAFTTLASYIFGGNVQKEKMPMTTPVATTWSGEMRFYIARPSDKSTSMSTTSTVSGLPQPLDNANVFIQQIPAARLAVRRFGGFVTAGEVSRQKQILLAQLALDGIALDVPHGQTVGHVVFQYNPPYTVPVLRRNEIAVPVMADVPDDLSTLWQE